MRVNQTYRSLLDKSVNSMLSAIEIYNKPNFSYREETFAILATNAIELLFKAQLLRVCSYKIKHLFVMEPVIKKDGTAHKIRKKPKLNRSKNPTTIGLFEVIKKLEDLLRFILSEIVDSGQDISIRTIEKADTIILKVKVADGELGKVIGKNGLTANAIRGVMQAAGVKDKLNVNVEFVD